jgi:hypothetical protein
MHELIVELSAKFDAECTEIASDVGAMLENLVARGALKL